MPQLTGIDPDAVDCLRSDGNTFDFDNGQIVTVNGESKVRIARDGYETKAIAFALLDVNNSQFGVISAGVPAFTINQSTIRQFNGGDIDSKEMVPG